MKLVIATRNDGKAGEFAEMLAGTGMEFDDLSNFPDAGDVEETGHTFLQNACLKASTYARRMERWTLADDSGLEVDALAGGPGVFSARWAALHGEAGSAEGDRIATDVKNLDLVLRQLEDVPGERRAARFVCVLAVADPNGRIVITVRGVMDGCLLREPRGTNGFGYDSIFLVPSLEKTSAELSSAEKHAISHRGAALRRLAALEPFALLTKLSHVSRDLVADIR